MYFILLNAQNEFPTILTFYPNSYNPYNNLPDKKKKQPRIPCTISVALSHVPCTISVALSRISSSSVEATQVYVPESSSFVLLMLRL